ncbi:MAG: hypothetical protein NTU79_17035 [Planctomycetota bacterium]|nr:hypothetical protein [Planctomycetota bacterium]
MTSQNPPIPIDARATKTRIENQPEKIVRIGELEYGPLRSDDAKLGVYGFIEMAFKVNREGSELVFIPVWDRYH